MAVEAIATEADDAAALPLRERTDGVLEPTGTIGARASRHKRNGRPRAATMHACLCAYAGPSSHRSEEETWLVCRRLAAAYSRTDV